MDYKLLDLDGVDSWHELGLEAQRNGTFPDFQAKFAKQVAVTCYFLKKDYEAFLWRLKGEIDEYHLLHQKRMKDAR